MNVLYVHTHDSGRYIGPYGYQTLSPNIDTLGKDSLVFRHCYCAGPTCSPSRAAFLTGTWPHCNGMIGLAHRGFRINNYRMHAARVFGENGYETILSGIQHEAENGLDIGYHRVFNQPETKDMYISDPASFDGRSTEELCSYLEGRASGRPFFASLGFISCHREFPVGNLNKDYIAPPPQLYDCGENREDMAGYLASVKIADECVGRLMDVMKKKHLYENTIIIFTTDHGIAFPWMKCNLYDTGIGVACMIRCPGNKRNGQVSDALVSQIDILPTLYELCGIQIPEWVTGKSLLPIINGECEKINDEIFAEVTYHASYEPMRCIRTDRYKFIRRFDSNSHIIPSNIDNGPAKQFLLKSGLLEKRNQEEMLFDLYLDPMERENLVGEEKYGEIYHVLTEKLRNWMEDTEDILLAAQDKIKPPEGAVVNKQSCLHAELMDFE